ncbi:MAG: DNA repair exonuclease [Sorangiineae bacterium]|nr:DNA repair exonuclease [Polyangiaceae bacterium]MEB2321659.1 DNA repair exonuclease [Sorangiineae bacterium]
MPKFLHAADLHIGSALTNLEQRDGAPVEAIRGAVERALGNLVELAIGEEVNFVVLAGDTFDTNPTLASERVFRRAMRRLGERGIPVVAVLGNHDFAGLSPQEGRLPDNVTVLSREAAESFEPAPGVVVHGRSYPRRDCREDLTDGFPEAVPGALNIGLLHTALTDTAHEPYAPTSPAKLGALHYQYWALGHVHQHSVMKEKGATIVFPGNLQGRHARETGAKGASVVSYDGTGVRGVEHRALDVVRWHHLRVDDAELAGDRVEALAARVRRETAEDRNQQRLSVVRLTLTGVPAAGGRHVSPDALASDLVVALDDDRDGIWLEKVLVERGRDLGGADGLELELAELTRALVAEEAEREALLQAVAHVRKQLRKTDASLLRASHDWALPAELRLRDGDPLSQDDAVALLARALDVILDARS